MKKILTSLTLLIFISTVSFSQSNDDKVYAKSLKKMFEVSGSEEAYKTAITQMMAMFKQQYSQVSAETWNGMEAEMLKVSMDDLVTKLIPVYKKYLTLEDVEGMIEFYNSPLGKKFAKNTPLIMQESMQVGQQWGMELGKKFEEKLKGIK